MTFSQQIIVPHEENWTKADIEKALKEYHDGSEHGWNLMYMGLKELVETGEISYKGSVTERSVRELDYGKVGGASTICGGVFVQVPRLRAISLENFGGGDFQ